MRLSTPLSAVLGATSVLALAATAAVATPSSNQPAAPAASQPDQQQIGAEEILPWRTKDDSVTATADEVLGSTGGMRSFGADQQQALVVVRATASGPAIETHKTKNRADAKAVITAAQADPNVLSIETAQAVNAEAINDQYYGQQWAMSTLRVEEAWKRSNGSGAVVAVLDTGVDTDHPDLAGQLMPGRTFLNGAQSAGAEDDFGHGTHVSGQIAALANNGIGIAGMAPGARILPVKALDSRGNGWDSDVASGIVWATNQGAHVVNLSLGGPNRSAAVAAAVRYAQSKNVLVVASSGNSGSAIVNYPAAENGVLAVGAMDSATQPASYSDYGPHLDVAAPGTQIYSLRMDGGVRRASGTSFASPHASAAAAMLFGATSGKVRGRNAYLILAGTADDVGAAGFDERTGFGMLDPNEALEKAACVAAGSCSLPMPNVSKNINQQVAQHVWLDLMGRPHDGAWVYRWGNAFDKGTKPSVLSGRLTASSEYRRGRIAGYYRTFLSRTGVPAGLSHWERRMKAGWTFQRIEAGFLASNEYYTRNGRNDRAWITSLYRTVLEREPTEPGLQYWLRQRRAGANRQAVAYRFVMCDQALAKLTNKRYREFINRDAHPIMQASWTRRMQSSYREENLIGSLVSSTDYRARH